MRTDAAWRGPAHRWWWGRLPIATFTALGTWLPSSGGKTSQRVAREVVDWWRCGVQVLVCARAHILQMGRTGRSLLMRAHEAAVAGFAFFAAGGCGVELARLQSGGG